MRVTVKLFATLREKREKESIMTLKPGTSPRDIINILDISEEEAKIIFVNGRAVELDKTLNDEDVVSIFPPVGGG